MKQNTKKINLAEILDAMLSQFDSMQYFINVKTGKLVLVQDETLAIVENGKTDYPEWQKEEVEEVEEYVKNAADYISLPTYYEIDDYSIMEEFSLNLENEKNSRNLLFALKGKGAFRRFKYTVEELELCGAWYAFKDEKYKQLALEWCEENDFDFC